MKIEVLEESCMQTHVTAADQDSEHTIEITDAEWKQFNDVEERYEQLLAGFRQRAAAARQATVDEIVQLRARLSQLEPRVGMAKDPVRPAPPQAPSLKPPRREIDANGIVAPPPLSETDAGRGTGMREKPIDPAEFRAELADLRDRTTEKWARRGR